MAVQPFPDVLDDGLHTPVVGSWALEKYRRVWYYDQMFSTGMKNQWNQRVYIDLFAGAGHARLRGTDRIVPSSAILSVLIPDRFTKYIFCDESEKCIGTLRTRVNRVAPGIDADFFVGDVNQRIDEIVDRIPPHDHNNRRLCFCFVDPFSIALDFETIRKIADGRIIDFLILLALKMDANRNLGIYLDENSDRLERFLGNPGWRHRWAEAEGRGKKFVLFLAEEYASAMSELNYLETPTDRMYPVRSGDLNQGLYYLAFFSAHERGYQFWDEVLKYADDQLGLGI